MTPAERAVHIAERKRIYEEIHGPAKGVGAAASNIAQGKGDATLKSSVASFTADTAAKTGHGASTIRRDAQRGETIGADALSKVVGTSLDKGEELDALAQLQQPAREARWRRGRLEPLGDGKDRRSRAPPFASTYYGCPQ